MNKVPGGAACAALPTTLLTEVLQHVPQQQRLTECALVCRAWAPAAAQATVHVQRDVRAKAVLSLQTWLAVHAGQLLTLNLAVTCHRKLYLPLDKLTNLQHLKLHGFKLLLPGDKDVLRSYPRAGSSDSSRDGSRGNSSQGSSHAAQLELPSLQKLELSAVQLSRVSSLLQLTSAPQLTRLWLNNIDVSDLGFSSSSQGGHRNSQQAVEAVAEAIYGVLQQLPRLTALWMPGFPFSDAAVQQTTALTGLQDITLTHVEMLPVCNLQHLCSSITQLQLTGHPKSMSHSLPPELPQLSGLLRLHLTDCEVPPGVLGSVPQLQELHMYECGLLPHEPEQRFATAGTAALRSALSKLTCLQALTLRLHCMDCDSISPQLFSALTASSHLKRLDMSRDDFMTIAQGAAQHMFPAGRQMQSLRHLAFNTSPQLFYSHEDWCIDGPGLQCIAQACPVLESLELGNSLQPGADLSALLQLPECFASLQGVGSAITDAAVPMVVQLTQLRELMWDWSPELTDVGLEQLAGLDLTCLQLSDCGISDGVTGSGYGYVCITQEPGLSVAQQLEELLDLSPELALSRLKRHKEASAAREEEHALQVSRLQDDLQRSHTRIQQLQQQLEAAQAQL